MQHDQALVASAGLAAARHMVGVDEVWPRQLASRTGYSMEEIKVCVQQILLQQDRLCIPRFTSLDRDVLEVRAYCMSGWEGCQVGFLTQFRRRISAHHRSALRWSVKVGTSMFDSFVFMILFH